MNAEEFVQALRTIPESEETLKAQGLSESYINDLLQSYQLTKRPDVNLTGNPVLDLVENYNSANLEIGMICFDERIEKGEDYVFFGKFEVDDLAVHKNLGTVVMLEDGSDQILYKCAGNGAQFLDAIIVAGGFLEKRANDDSLYENQELTCKIAEECGDLAGSKSDYQDFYKMLLGCDDF